MGYVAVKGGTEAIEASIKMLNDKRIESNLVADIDVIKASMRQMINQIMSEASLYDRDLAALAIKQAEGNMEEAVFLLRAHRSTLPRLYYSNTVDTRQMFVERRVSASFKDIPGGQILGASPDFTHRLLDFSLIDEQLPVKAIDKESVENDTIDLSHLPKVIDYLADVGLYELKEKNDEAPDDITKKAITFPASRSQILQSLTRGQTGAVTALGYAEIRGYGFSTHPNIGELRVGQQPVYVMHEENSDESYFIGDFEMTEVESFYSAHKASSEKDTFDEMTIELGYGITFGQNETKTIAMSILDHSLNQPDFDVPTSDDEFVLMHIDSVESTGFISHLKLPHYVTFQSMLDRIRQTIKENQNEV
ncbi:carbon-phosphorus lyase complex subunit PhnI [Macrococcoides caseolyticum]|uniref:carbon-phosphorus lyase complex subunit PhnI n=1 Tax=Macrococcoides caseolyticum TaxID=69966 RepID=UPI001F24CBB3|nr:carbon-phosphorus lyase complex subunit PhnI [Macrococcus caseolyticus]MCE4956015.1 carbon-phosphorus lyase complex subunit PhnI [Macrococcus caseolyticus]